LFQTISQSLRQAYTAFNIDLSVYGNAVKAVWISTKKMVGIGKDRFKI